MLRLRGSLVAVIALALSGSAAAQSGPVAQATTGGADARALLDRYCVTCHNERLQTAGLMLDQVDLAAVGTHAEVLEKVVRKLRAGQMPPPGRPRPDGANVAAFVASLEAALDRQAETDPDPGRVASRRMNRLEYVNAVQDLLALEIDGAEMLPSDMAGLEFDTNADVLSMTPSLMARYTAAATKISRAAIGSPDNRPARKVYQLGFETQTARMNEDMPLATHGGLAARHMFPLDGEYVFTVRMKGTGAGGGGGVLGIGEDDHDIELRLDHALVKRWNVGGRFPGPDPGVLIPIPDDDVEGIRLHEYRLNADKGLEIRLPVKAGQRLVAVALTDSNPTPLDGGLWTPGHPPVVHLRSLPTAAVAEEDTPSRRRIFVCRPAAADDEERCAREISRLLVRRAYRRPVTESDLEPLLGSIGAGRRERDFEAGVERALEALLSMPDSSCASNSSRATARPGDIYRLTDVELASRLSFFLWRSIPDDELLEVAAANRLRDPGVLAHQVERMLADRRATRFMNDFVGQWLKVRNIHAQSPDGNLFARIQRHPAQRDVARDGVVLREPGCGKTDPSRSSCAPTTPI